MFRRINHRSFHVFHTPACFVSIPSLNTPVPWSGNGNRNGVVWVFFLGTVDPTEGIGAGGDCDAGVALKDEGDTGVEVGIGVGVVVG